MIGNTILKIKLTSFKLPKYNIYSLPAVISLSLTPWSLFGGLVGNALAGDDLVVVEGNNPGGH